MQEKTRPGIRKNTEGLEPANSLLVHDVKNLSFRLGALLQNLDTHYEDPLFKKSIRDVQGSLDVPDDDAPPPTRSMADAAKVAEGEPKKLSQ